MSQTAYWPPVFREDFSDQLQPRFEPQLQSLDRFHRPHKLCLQMLTTALVSQLLQFHNQAFTSQYLPLPVSCHMILRCECMIDILFRAHELILELFHL